MTTKRYPKSGKHVLVLRACQSNMESRNNFKYPASGMVRDPHFSNTAACGNGLHGWRWGFGDCGLIPDYALNWRADTAKWLVIKVLKADVIELTGKVKFPKGEVIHVGTKASAGRYIEDRRPAGTLAKAHARHDHEIVQRSR